MSPQLPPGDLKKALQLIESDPPRAWTIDELAKACGVARRTLQTHFRRFTGRAPVEYLRDVRLDRAQQELRRAPPSASVTEIATRCGFSHLGRFATWYRARYNETPSTTLQCPQIGSARSAPFLPLLSSGFERPAVAVLPFDLAGNEAHCAAGMAEEIAAALVRLRWISVSTVANTRYRLRGRVRGDGMGRLRVTVILIDAATGRIIWTDHWDGRCNDAFEFEERVAACAARAIEPALRGAEIDRASQQILIGSL